LQSQRFVVNIILRIRGIPFFAAKEVVRVRNPLSPADGTAALMLVALLPFVLLAQNPEQLEPSMQEPAGQVEYQQAQEAMLAECDGGYTTTTCSFENEKFVRDFDLFAAILLGAVSALVIPLLLGIVGIRRMRWWRANCWFRWLWPMLCGLLLAGAAFLVLPLFAYRGSRWVPPWLGLAPFFGVKEEFFASCTPCSAQVSNYPPLFGWFGSLGVPSMGLTIEQPGSLLLALLLAFLIFSLLFLAIHVLWRKLRGFGQLCGREETT
jgi:hypothetical protein